MWIRRQGGPRQGRCHQSCWSRGEKGIEATRPITPSSPNQPTNQPIYTWGCILGQLVLWQRAQEECLAVTPPVRGNQGRGNESRNEMG